MISDIHVIHVSQSVEPELMVQNIELLKAPSQQLFFYVLAEY